MVSSFLIDVQGNVDFSFIVEVLQYCRGQVQVRSRSERSEIDLSLTLFLVCTHPPTTTTLHHKLFSWLLRGLDMSDGPRMGWYDSSRV